MPIETKNSQNTKRKKDKSILASIAEGGADGFLFAEENMATALFSPVFILGGGVVGGIKGTIRSVKNNNKKYDFKMEEKTEINGHLENQRSNSSKALTLSK